MSEKKYIDQEAVALQVRRYLMPNVQDDGTVHVGDAERYFLNLLEKAPAADVVEVVHARWITEENTEGYRGDPHCTACKGILDDEAVYGYTPGVDSFYYCPNCGAKMDGGK